jgi:hypothetical protein
VPLPSPSDLTGPSAALFLLTAFVVGLARVVLILWHDHLRADLDDRAQRDRAQELADKAIAGMAELADAWRERDAHDAERRRRGDR